MPYVQVQEAVCRDDRLHGARAPVLRVAHHSAEVQVPVWEARGEFLTAPILSISLNFLTQIPRRENRAEHIQKWTKEYVDEVSDKDAF